MSSLTVTDVANKLGVTRAVAYGLIHLMVKTGVLKPIEDKRRAGKGKPSDLYIFTHEHATKMAEMISSLETYVPTVAAVTVPLEETDKGHVGHVDRAKTETVESDNEYSTRIFNEFIKDGLDNHAIRTL